MESAGHSVSILLTVPPALYSSFFVQVCPSMPTPASPLPPQDLAGPVVDGLVTPVPPLGQ
jgi:hypothetical protein